MTEHVVTARRFITLQDLTEQILSGGLERAEWNSLRRLFTADYDKTRVAAWNRLADWASSNGIEWSIEAREPFTVPSDSVVVFRAPT